MTKTTDYATAAESSKMCKALLSATFPRTTFFTRLGRGTGYGSLTIRWTDGPTVAAVEVAVRDQFEGKAFDGMDDSTHSLNAIMPDGRRSGLGYLFYHRTISAVLARRCVAQIAAYWGVEPVAVYEARNGYGYELTGDDTYLCPAAERGQFYDWYALIHQAAEDATRFARAVPA